MMKVDRIVLNAKEEALLKQIVLFFGAKGWQIIVGYGFGSNFYAESGFRHNVWGDRETAYGLGQWHGDRREHFETLFGIPINKSTFVQQLEFAHWEITKGPEKGVGVKLKMARSAREAGAIISMFYERPALKKAEATVRGDLAQKLFSLYEKTNIVPIRPGTPTV